MKKLWTVKDDAYGHSVESANGNWISVTTGFGAAWLAGELNRLHQVELRLKKLEGAQQMSEHLECTWCGDDASELRWTGESNGRGKPVDPMCQECCPDFSTGGCGDPVMDGPCFDDLPIAQKAAPVRENRGAEE